MLFFSFVYVLMLQIYELFWKEVSENTKNMLCEGKKSRIIRIFAGRKYVEDLYYP